MLELKCIEGFNKIVMGFLSTLLADLFRGVLEVTLHLAGYLIGYPATYLLSFGWLHPADLEEIDNEEFQKSVHIPWWHLTYVRDNQRFLRAECVILVGVLFLLLVIAFLTLIILWSLGYSLK